MKIPLPRPGTEHWEPLSHGCQNTRHTCIPQWCCWPSRSSAGRWALSRSWCTSWCRSVSRCPGSAADLPACTLCKWATTNSIFDAPPWKEPLGWGYFWPCGEVPDQHTNFGAPRCQSALVHLPLQRLWFITTPPLTTIMMIIIVILLLLQMMIMMRRRRIMIILVYSTQSVQISSKRCMTRSCTTCSKCMLHYVQMTSPLFTFIIGKYAYFSVYHMTQN